MKILCKTCNHWCDCGVKDGKPHGFCFMEDLFTYTWRSKCSNYVSGDPVTEEEFENPKLIKKGSKK